MSLHIIRLLFPLDLLQLSDCQDLPIDLEPYVKKLIGSRRRIMLVNSILQNAQVNCWNIRQPTFLDATKILILLFPTGKAEKT